MILKIATGDGWWFLDGVKEVFASAVELKNHDKNKPSYIEWDKAYHDVFLYYHELRDGRLTENEIVPGGTATKTDILEIVPHMANGERRIYIADLAVYLLSDEGKTIERIN